MLHLSLALAAALAADDDFDFEIEPAQVLSVAPIQDDETAAEDENEGWEGAVTVGASITDGNTDVTNASATADALHEEDDDRWTLGFTWNYSEDAGVVTQRKTYGRAQYDHFLTEKTYWLAQASAEADEEAGVDLRTTLGVGIGQQFRDDETWKVAGEVGLTWFTQDFEEGDDEDYIAARLAAKWEYNHSDTWSFGQTAEIFPSLEDNDDIYSKLDTRVKATLTEKMFAQFQWIWDWDNTPAEGSERSDHLYLLTLGWQF